MMNHTPLLQVTEPAAQHIASILARHEGATGLFLSIKKTGCSGYQYILQCINDTDRSCIRIHHAQENITFFVDAQWAKAFQGTTIDLVDEILGQKRLVFNNPNTEDECGCGESFGFKEAF